jgi:hypothetical protein
MRILFGLGLFMVIVLAIICIVKLIKQDGNPVNDGFS